MISISGNVFLQDPPGHLRLHRVQRTPPLRRCLPWIWAFMAMDLDFNDQSDLGRRFIDGYVEASGDTELVEMLDFYKCYRAYVRGKIACFTSSDPALDDDAKTRPAPTLPRR